MYRELNVDDIIYTLDVKDIKINTRQKQLPEYTDVYDKIKIALNIDKEGYNIFIIDDYSKEKLNNLIEYIQDLFEGKGNGPDICYVVKNDEKCPEVIMLSGGKGILLKETLDGMQNAYMEGIVDFYNSDSDSEKNEIMENIQKKRNGLVSELVKNAEDEGFDIKLTENGFTFIPLDEGKGMSEKDYENLETGRKDEIVNKVSKLKLKAQRILEKIKDDEIEETEKIKILFSKYIESKMVTYKEKYNEEFVNDKCAVDYLDFVSNSIEKNLLENFTLSLSEDDDNYSEIIEKFIINVIVDNSKKKTLPIIYEEDPCINNLLGSIEYENKNGVYSTDTSLIKGGALHKANGGCLILRASSLLNNPSAYYYLKKALMGGKVDLDYNRNYIELLSLSGIKPEPVKIKEKVIIIGDYETYDLLYTYDEDFKKVFQVRAEYEPIVKLNDDSINALLNHVYSICKENNLISLTNGALKEVIKYLSRKAESKNKVYFDCVELNKVLMITNVKARENKKEVVNGVDITDVVYSRELLEKEILESYSENKTLIKVDGTTVGQVNALSVISTGYLSIGKPLRVTCSCCSGDGNIIDVQKESNLSGNIHNKAVNILKGYMNILLGGYTKLPMDFQLNFEQVYGKIDGDSASVAEIICMISALSKLPVKQNIAITGSINQFGEVQPVGGVNEKIEGFFNVCKAVNTVEGKGVLIPGRNKDNLVLNSEVEEAIAKGRFHIYTMENVSDAVELVMGSEKAEMDYVVDVINREIKKYTIKDPKK